MAKLLDTIRSPADLKEFSREQLEELACEIRARIIEVVSRNGGHLASNLGVTELTLALHRTFDFSRDRLLWDVGHQCYVHKLITGRNAEFDTLRQAGGLSGFPSTKESPYDLFDVGHAGTSIATAVGMARGDTILGRDSHVVALIGDASIVNGVAFEGLNQAGTLKRQFMVVFNDPVEQKDHVERAARMALAMRTDVESLRAGWQRKGYEIDFGMGIHTGYATCGFIGYEGRRDYGVIGNVTNLAARLSDAASEGEILITSRVRDELPSGYESRPAGELELKGFQRPQPAFRLLPGRV